MHLGKPSGTAISCPHSSAVFSQPILRTAVAGKAALRSAVVVKKAGRHLGLLDLVVLHYLSKKLSGGGENSLPGIILGGGSAPDTSTHRHPPRPPLREGTEPPLSSITYSRALLTISWRGESMMLLMSALPTTAA